MWFILKQGSVCSLRCCQLLAFPSMALRNGVGTADECIMLWEKEQGAGKAWSDNLRPCCFDPWMKSVWLGLYVTSLSCPAKGSEFILRIPAWKFTWKAANRLRNIPVNFMCTNKGSYIALLLQCFLKEALKFCSLLFSVLPVAAVALQ